MTRRVMISHERSWATIPNDLRTMLTDADERRFANALTILDIPAFDVFPISLNIMG